MDGFIVYLTPEELEHMSEEKLQSSDSIHEFDELLDKKDMVETLMDRLPKREADMLYFYFYKKKFQADVGKIFGVSQGDVSYRIKRAIKRIKFLLNYPDIDPDLMIEELSEVLPFENINEVLTEDVIRKITPSGLDFCGSNMYLRIMVGMYQTSSQSVVANQLGIYQNRVRYRFLKGLAILKEHSKKDYRYEKYVTAFDMVADNHNILRELKVQDRWKHKFMDVLV